MELLVKRHYSSSLPENIHGVGPVLYDRLQVHLDSQAGTLAGAGVAVEDFLASWMDTICIGRK